MTNTIKATICSGLSTALSLYEVQDGEKLMGAVLGGVATVCILSTFYLGAFEIVRRMTPERNHRLIPPDHSRPAP